MAGNESLGRSEQMWKVLKRSVKNSLVYGGSKTLLLVAAAAGPGSRVSRIRLSRIRLSSIHLTTYGAFFCGLLDKDQNEYHIRLAHTPTFSMIPNNII